VCSSDLPFRKKGLSKKLSYLWRGPFRIIEVKEPNHVKLQSLSGKIVDHMVNVNTLTKYHKWDENMGEEVRKDEFEVDKIMEEKQEEGKKYYLIKWKGCSNKFNSWEPERSLYHAKEKVKEWNDQQSKGMLAIQKELGEVPLVKKDQEKNTVERKLID